MALVRGQFWLIPATMGAGGLVLALWVLRSGAALEKPFGPKAWWLYSGDAATARDLLSTLLSGVITMASLMVSLTFVVLSLAANQLGPRLVTIITGDRQIQGALGFLLGTVAYVLVILRSLDETLGREGVPHLAITFASGLTLLSLLALLLYMHKISRSIISDVVVRKVAHELRESIERAPEPTPGAALTPQDFGRIASLALGRAGVCGDHRLRRASRSSQFRRRDRAAPCEGRSFRAEGGRARGNPRAWSAADFDR
jgi:uncharacterized membrane protein